MSTFALRTVGSASLRSSRTAVSSFVRVKCRASSSSRGVATMPVNIDQLKAAKVDLVGLISSVKCNPILVRLAWHDSGTYNKEIAEFPTCGGANGSIRFKPEIDHGANAGLAAGLALVEPIKVKCPEVSYADLYQMASAVAIEVAGGPNMPMRYGRVDAQGPDDCPPEGNLPAAAAPFPDKAPTPADHLRKVFYRMGLNDQEIVALSGAHTIGRAYKNRSGFGKDATKYTIDGPGTKGGSSWTPEWLKFDNSYFVEVKEKKDAELLVLETDACLFEDAGFKPFAEKYAQDQAAFFADYTAAHLKLSELGSKWVEGGPVTLDA